MTQEEKGVLFDSAASGEMNGQRVIHWGRERRTWADMLNPCVHGAFEWVGVARKWAELSNREVDAT